MVLLPTTLGVGSTLLISCKLKMLASSFTEVKLFISLGLTETENIFELELALASSRSAEIIFEAVAKDLKNRIRKIKERAIIIL
jgi:hypothetical protein